MATPRRFALLAPAQGGVPADFSRVIQQRERFSNLLAETQRFRGRIYLQDGAVQASQLSSDGRHVLADDEQSWHLLLIDDSDKVLGCMRYRLHNNSVPVSSLGVSSSALARCDRWGVRLRKALENEMVSARHEGVGFSEIGGWALAPELRCSSEALRIVLGTFGLAQLLGDARGVGTATVRHSSSKILRRIGGRSILSDDTELPSYFDPHYGCDMEVLRFDSRTPNPRYAPWVEELQAELLISPVICATLPREGRNLYSFVLSGYLELALSEKVR